MHAPPPAVSPAVLRAHCPHFASARGAFCGYLPVPLDRRHPRGRRIRIYFELYPRRDTTRPATSTIVSIEGGPGYSTTADRVNRIALAGPLMARRDLLLVDLRGTGRSGALDCRAFTHHILPYLARAGRCARQLGPKRDFYDTSQSVQDVEAVLAAVHAGKVDLYGDSYGSYAAQAFALRYPSRLRSLVLDGTYQVPGSDPFFRDLAARTRIALRLACTRRPPCMSHGDPVAALGRLVRLVRRHPITGWTWDGDGDRVFARVNEDALVQIAGSGYYYQAVWRDLPAAIRSARGGDDQPLLRLAAETVTTDGPEETPSYGSEALYLSVVCHDYPQPWPFSAPAADRLAITHARLRQIGTGPFHPFSGIAWIGYPYEGGLECLDWPSPAFADPPAPPHARYPDVPTLVLNGDVDNITPLEDARVVASRFPNSHLVVIQNDVHVTALEDNFDCPKNIYAHFVQTLAPGDTSCARRTPEVRVVDAFPLHVSGVAPATATAGDSSTLLERRVAAAAAGSVADALQRWWDNYSGFDHGLRGGTWTYSGSGDVTTFHLHGAAFVPGVGVSGNVRWSYSHGWVRGTVTVSGPGAVHERLHLSWSQQVRRAGALLRGTAGGHPLRLRMLAP
jgi:pimeloyl-ACP methyl ester carboxylesterase